MTSRRGGISPPPFDSLNLGRSTDDDPDVVSENRRRALVALGLDPAACATAGQVHGADVAVATGPGLHARADALVTRVPGLALAVTAADCLPIVLLAPGAVCVAHSGWRGTVAGMPRAALDAVRAAAGIRSGAGSRAVRALLGPCIGPCCYRVGDEVALQFPPAAVVRDATGPRVDLAAAARLQLVEAGVPADSVLDPPVCTSCSPEWCFSHRRDRGRTGRLWAVVALTE